MKALSNHNKDDLIRAFQSVEWFVFLKDPSTSEAEFLEFLSIQKDQLEKRSHSSICKLIKELEVEGAVLHILETKKEGYVLAPTNTLRPPTFFKNQPLKQSRKVR